MTAVAFLVTAATLLAPKEWTARLDVVVGGIPSGTAALVQRLLPDGGKQVELTMELRPARGSAVRVRQESVYDSLGKPVRKIQETTSAGKQVGLLVATFDPAGAKVQSGSGNKASTTIVPLDNQLSRANAAELWFVSKTPQIGDRVVCYTFDLGAMRWDLTETRYLGRKDGHRIETRRSGTVTSTLLDDDGMPLRVESGDLILTRSKDKEPGG